MNTIIHQIAEEFTKNIFKIFGENEIDFSKIERLLLIETKETAAKIVGARIEYIDQALVADKARRKKEGFVIERRNDIRHLQTLIGEISYKRTYFKKASGGYEYLADTAMGIESNMRVSKELGLELVKAAKDMSYQKAINYVTGGRISRQTVMLKIRKSTPVISAEVKKRSVNEIHIDADEAHVTLHGGKKSYVPLISVYEGIEKQRKRNSCKNVFHISEYGMKPDDLWEYVSTEIIRRYDIEKTKIYLHGDGGNWISKGLEWLPGSIFVLDKYHKNKAIKQMTAGLDRINRKKYDKEIREALDLEETRYFNELTESLCYQFPEREEKILEASKYLRHFVSGISICKKDERSNNGGCTEPHVSNVLSIRLSNRPMAWSKETLKQLAPILAGGEICYAKDTTGLRLPKALHKVAASASKAFCKASAKQVKNSLGLPKPESIGTLIPLQGKVVPITHLLKRF